MVSLQTVFTYPQAFLACTCRTAQLKRDYYMVLPTCTCTLLTLSAMQTLSLIHNMYIPDTHNVHCKKNKYMFGYCNCCTMYMYIGCKHEHVQYKCTFGNLAFLCGDMYCTCTICTWQSVNPSINLLCVHSIGLIKWFILNWFFLLSSGRMSIVNLFSN